MRASASRVLSAVILSLAAAGGVAGCGTDEDSGAGSAVVGTWDATSFTVAGTDLIAANMTISFTFTSSDTYSFSVTNDQGGFCDVGSTCTDGGVYTATATVITLDPGTTDATALNYTISGNTMTVTATIDGISITATFDKR